MTSSPQSVEPAPVSKGGERKKKALWIGLAALAVVVAIVCVLVFVVFSDQIFGGASGPEQKVTETLTALEDRDADTLFALLDPQGISYLENTAQMEPEALKATLAQQVATFDSIDYSDVKMNTEMAPDGQKATVTLVGGKMTTVSAGQSTVEDLEDSVEPQTYYLILRDGTWYLDIVQMTRQGG